MLIISFLLLSLILITLIFIYFRLYDICQAIEFKGTMLDGNWLDKPKPRRKK